MRKSLMISILLIINGYAFSSTPKDIHRQFLDSLQPDDIENEYCATTLSKADIEYLEWRWKKEEIETENLPTPYTIQPLASSQDHPNQAP